MTNHPSHRQIEKGPQNTGLAYDKKDRPKFDISAPLIQLLNLIAATILADHRPEKSGCKLFLKELKALEPARHFGRTPTEARLLLWYEMNKGDIQKTLNSSQFEAWYNELLEGLSAFPEKSSVLRTMFRLTRSNSRAYTNGRALRTLAAHHWGHS